MANILFLPLRAISLLDNVLTLYVGKNLNYAMLVDDLLQLVSYC